MRKALRAIAAPVTKALRNSVRRRGWDFVKTPNLSQFLDSRNVDLVIDVGANKGDYGYHLRRWGYRGAIVSIEPASGPYAALQRRVNGDKRWTPIRVALGDHSGQAEINISRASVFNSLLPQTGLANAFDPQMEIIATETIELRKLDEVLADRPFSAGFLKIDVQGTEKAGA
jgi:FkbM family methyltransferase